MPCRPLRSGDTRFVPELPTLPVSQDSAISIPKATEEPWAVIEAKRLLLSGRANTGNWIPPRTNAINASKTIEAKRRRFTCAVAGPPGYGGPIGSFLLTFRIRAMAAALVMASG